MGVFDNVGDQRTRSGPPGPEGPPGPGFEEDKDGNFDVQETKLVRVKQCTNSGDAANKKYVDDTLGGIGNLANIGRWVGSLKGIGNRIDLGFDSSKGQLFNFTMKEGNNQVTMTETRLCSQNTRVILIPWISVTPPGKIYDIGVRFNGNILEIMTGDDSAPVEITSVECFAIHGYLTDRVGPRGPQGQPGAGVLLDDDGNYDLAGKRLTEVGRPEDDDDAINKDYLEEQFLQPNMTRNVFSKGISMEGARIDGLQEPQALSDATTKGYVDTKLAVVANQVAVEDAKLARKIDDGDTYKSIQTKNVLNLKSGDFTGGNGFGVFLLGKERDYTRKYHNSRTHVVCSLNRNTGRLLVNLGAFKSGKYGVRVEGIIDPNDDSSRFDIDVNTVNDGVITMRTRYKEKIDPHAVAVDLEIEARANVGNLNIAIEIDHVPGKEIALFFSGRRGEGQVDPLLVDNIDYHEKIKIPAYTSFNQRNRRRQIGISDTFESEYPNHPIKNLLADFNHFQKNSNGAFRFNKAYEGHGTMVLYFPCLVSLASITFTQKTDSNHGQYMIRCFNEKTGLPMDLVGRDGFTWDGMSIEVLLEENVSRIYEISLVRGRTTPNVDILPLQFSTREALF